MQLQQEISNALEVLNKGGLILYPTDTVWGIGCDATKEEAIAQIYKIKNRPEDSPLICLVSNIRMLEKYVYEVPDIAYDLIEASDTPLTIIYDNPMNVAANLPGNDNSLAIRVVKDEFCQRLIAKFKRPLISTSANLSGKPGPASFERIDKSLKGKIDYIVDPSVQRTRNKPSTIIKISNNGEFKIIRK